MCVFNLGCHARTCIRTRRLFHHPPLHHALRGRWSECARRPPSRVRPRAQRRWLCARQQRVSNRTDTRGCFILNHNDPSILAYRDDYNTTADLTAILGSHGRHPLWRHFAQGVRVFVALCFKAPIATMCDGGPDAAAWISLVDDLVAALNAVRAADTKLNVEFVLDGGVPPAPCLLQRWRPWVSTGGPATGFTANGSASGDDRWQVSSSEDVPWSTPGTVTLSTPPRCTAPSLCHTRWGDGAPASALWWSRFAWVTRVGARDVPSLSHKLTVLAWCVRDASGPEPILGFNDEAVRSRQVGQVCKLVVRISGTARPLLSIILLIFPTHSVLA